MQHAGELNLLYCEMERKLLFLYEVALLSPIYIHVALKFSNEHLL